MNRMLVALVCIFSLAACSDEKAPKDGEKTACDRIDDFQACGGDVVGTWEYDAACLRTDRTTSPIASCPGATGVPTMDLTGTATFGADGTLTGSQTVINTLRMTVPRSCLQASQTCAQFAESLDGDPPAVVEDIAERCVLEARQTQTFPLHDTYSVDGNRLVIGTPAPDELLEYCVDGAHFTALDTNPQDDGSTIKILYEARRK